MPSIRMTRSQSSQRSAMVKHRAVKAAVLSQFKTLSLPLLISRSVPSSPATGDAIECVIDSPSTDDDGDAISYTFDWTVEGSPYLVEQLHLIDQ